MIQKAKQLATVVAAIAILGGSAQAQDVLVTGKKITLPPLGAVQNVGSLPMNIVLSPSGKYAVSTDMGFRQSLWSIDAKTGAGVSHVDFPNNADGSNGLYYGLAFGPDGKLYAAQGAHDSIAVLALAADGTLTQTGSIAAQAHDFPAGVATDSRGYLYVANNDPATPLQPSSIAIYSTATGASVGRYSFSASFYGTPNYPLSVAALADGSKMFVTSERDGAVYVLNTSNPAAPALITSIATGAQPDGLLLNKTQTRLYVSNAHSDTVSVIDTATNAIVDTILLQPTGAHGLAGVTPNGLALSPDENTLYVSLGDFNAVGVVDLASNSLKGYIPAGWYPTGVVATDSKRLLVANAKGTVTRNPNPGYLTDPNGQYILNLIEGNVETIAVPNSVLLAQDTKLALANNRITPTTTNPVNPVSSIGVKAGKIKHVIYIVKENRTYDQVLGDVPTGNGQPSLAIFGQPVTPNLHAIAQRFVLLDNFYDCGEASGDGWPWSTQSIATENVIKNLPYNYSGRGRNYDFEGQNNGYLTGGFPAANPDGKTLSPVFPGGLPRIPDVTEAPAGHIWDAVKKAKLSYRNYGFFYSFGVGSLLPDNYPAASGLLPPGHDLAGVSDYDFRRFDSDYADSEAPITYYNQTGNPAFLYKITNYGKHQAPSRFTEWKTEFNQLLAKDPTGKAVPTFQTVRFMKDHTQGTSPGKHTPRSEVADNDYAIGQLVEAVSKSPIWDSTAIFVIEDDAQDGPDHVDAHRSTCYVISPWIKKSTVDHTFYNTDSVLKTVEGLLGLKPLSQYDAIADPIQAFDTAPTNGDVYTAILPDASIIGELNPSIVALKSNPTMARLAALSSKMDFTHPDSAPAQTLNEILWKSVKGAGSTMPAIRHGLSAAPAPKSAHAASRKHDGDDD